MAARRQLGAQAKVWEDLDETLEQVYIAYTDAEDAEVDTLDAIYDLPTREYSDRSPYRPEWVDEDIRR